MSKVDESRAGFRQEFTRFFSAQFPKLFRYLDRLGGDPGSASDIAQEALVKLYQRGEMPDSPEAWTVTVALNLFRNQRSTERRRLQILESSSAPRELDEATASEGPARSAAQRDRVRTALEQLSERERSLLLLRSEGYSYQQLAASLQIQETSVGTLLARARRAFIERYGENADASG